jgi:hypothetical protein
MAATMGQNCVLDPLGTVRRLFAAHLDATGAAQAPPADGVDAGVEDYFRSVLADPSIAQQVHSHHVEDGHSTPAIHSC